MSFKSIPSTHNDSVVEDSTFQKIMSELSTKLGTKKGGRPIGLDWQTYVQIIKGLEYGQRPEDLIKLGIVKRNAFYDYKRKSPTFSNAVSRATGTTYRHAVFAMALAVRYIPEHFKTVKDREGNEISIRVPEKLPDMPSVRWWLSHEKESKKRFSSKVAVRDVIS